MWSTQIEKPQKKLRPVRLARPEGAEALSPGHRPGLSCSQTCRPVRAKALKLRLFTKLLPLQGALLIAIIPRAMPWAKSFCPFRACCFYGLLPFTFALPFDQRFSIPLCAGDVGSGRAAYRSFWDFPTVQVKKFSSAY